MGDTNLMVNETILNMVKNLNPTTNVKKMSPFTFTPVKRSISSSNSAESSFDEPSSKKCKRDSSKLDISYIGSPREMRRLRYDLVEARSIILNLESRISHMHGVRKQMQLMFDEENATLKRQHEHDKKSLIELENQLQTIRKREGDLKKQLADVGLSYILLSYKILLKYFQVNSKYDSLKLNARENENALEKSIHELREEAKQIESHENEVVPKLQRRIAELETMLEAAEEDAESQKKLAVQLGMSLYLFFWSF